MKIVKLIVSLLVLLTLVACSSEQGRDSSAEIEKEISASANEDTFEDDFHVPAIFYNYEASEKHRITFFPDTGIHIYQSGNIKSNKTKIEYKDLDIQTIDIYAWAEYNKVSVSKNVKENLAQLVESHDFSEVKKYTVNGNDFYVSNIFRDNISTVNVYYNIGDNIFFASSYLVNEKEISDRTAKKICKDLSPFE
ncbi:MAG: hypothetical protein IJZ57_04630 [Clostridia bacterium]|nr:hypothetical protein [Clostridia bacterium]